MTRKMPSVRPSRAEIAKMFEEKNKSKNDASVAPESTRLDILSDQEFSFQPYKKPAQKKPPNAPARLNFPAKKPTPKASPKAAPKRPAYGSKRPSAKRPTWFGKKAGYKGQNQGGRMHGYYAAIQRRRQQAKIAAQKRAEAAKLARRKEIAAKLAEKMQAHKEQKEMEQLAIEVEGSGIGDSDRLDGLSGRSGGPAGPGGLMARGQRWQPMEKQNTNENARFIVNLGQVFQDFNFEDYFQMNDFEEILEEANEIVEQNANQSESFSLGTDYAFDYTYTDDFTQAAEGKFIDWTSSNPDIAKLEEVIGEERNAIRCWTCKRTYWDSGSTGEYQYLIDHGGPRIPDFRF